MHPDAQVSDRSLILRVLDGDPRAADRFVTRFTRLVWWILIHQLRLAPESAEDLYQDVFVRLCEDDHRRLRNWSGEGDFAAYLAPIVRHLALDRIRTSPPPGPDAGRPDAPPPDPADDRPGPEEVARLDQQRRRLERAVATLAPRDRRLYELRFVEERSYREIAAACDITVNHVGVRLTRLVERLRLAVAERLPAKPPRTGDAVRSPSAGPSIE